MQRRCGAILVSLLLLGACAGARDLGPYSDLRWKIQQFYADNAWEMGATCVLPRMSITDWRVVEQTPEQMILEVRYHWLDDRNRDSPFDRGFGFGSGWCEGFNTRRFTVVKAPTGFQVSAMTGEQRPR